MQNKELGMSPLYKYSLLILLSIGAGTIFIVPYLTNSYYDAIKGATGISSDATFGTLMVAYSIISTLLYLPSGIIADKVRVRYLFSFSLVGTGILTFIYIFAIKNFAALIVVHMCLAIVTVLTFWAAFIKAVRLLGSVKEQPTLFSISEATRNLTSLVGTILFGVIITALVTSGGEELAGIQFGLLFLSLVYVTIGIASFFVLPKEDNEEKVTFSYIKKIITTKKTEAEKEIIRNSDTAINKKNIKEVLKIKNIWIAGAMMFCIIVSFNIMWTYYPMYELQFNNVDKGTSSLLTQLRAYGIVPVFGVTSGIIANKYTGSASKQLVFVGAFTLLLAPLLFISNPTTSIVMSFLVIGIIGASRGIYWSTIAESGVQKNLHGTAVGVVSVMAYSGDMFLKPSIGAILDATKENDVNTLKGFNIVFAVMYVIIFIGFLLAFWVFINYRKAQKIISKENMIDINKKPKIKEIEIIKKAKHTQSSSNLNKIKISLGYKECLQHGKNTRQ